MFNRSFAAVMLVALTAGAAHADEVIFNNGDRITGKVLSVEGGKMTIDSKLAGEIKVDMKEVKTFTTDAPIEIRTTDGQKVNAKATASETSGQVNVQPSGAAAPKAMPLGNVKYVNFDESWQGNVIAGALFARGNTFADQVNIEFNLLRRTEEDRWTFSGGYHFGRERSPDTGAKTTTTDNWFATGQYDHFFTPKLYGFAGLRYEHDRIADLDVRLTPAVGLGYQWIDQPDLTFNTEAGLAYVWEKFEDDTTNDNIALKLAYHLTKKFDKIALFHNLEYYPSIERIDDYLIITDAGIRADITTRIFAQYKIEWRYDATPASDNSRSDLRHIIGLGWKL